MPMQQCGTWHEANETCASCLPESPRDRCTTCGRTRAQHQPERGIYLVHA